MTDDRTRFDVGDDIATALQITAAILGELLRDKFGDDGSYSYQYASDTIQLAGGEHDILTAYRLT